VTRLLFSKAAGAGRVMLRRLGIELRLLSSGCRTRSESTVYGSALPPSSLRALGPVCTAAESIPMAGWLGDVGIDCVSEYGTGLICACLMLVAVYMPFVIQGATKLIIFYV